MKVLITDYDFPDIELERGIFAAAGIELVAGQCRTEQAVIEAAAGCSALLVQYAPITDRVLAALPQVGLASRMGAGYDTIDPAACARHGVWLANSPDYGVGEVATHALAMALALQRHLPFYDRDVKAGNWHYLSAGKIRRAAGLTVGILGLGRIGKRFAHLARNAFARVVACDPYIIDGDFPAYVERVTLQQLFETADIISLHVPLNDETRGMVNAALLSSVQPGTTLVNTARGAGPATRIAIPRSGRASRFEAIDQSEPIGAWSDSLETPDDEYLWALQRTSASPPSMHRFRGDAA